MEKMLDKYAAAVRAKDVDAFVGLYADDVRTGAEVEERLRERGDERDDAHYSTRLRYFGSSASIKPSPRKLSPMTASMIAMPG